MRAVETARLACEPFGTEPELVEELRGGDFDPAELAAGRGNVLLVGHEPDFSRAIQVATGAHAEMKKGGLAALDGRLLLSLLRPAQIKRIAAAAELATASRPAGRRARRAPRAGARGCAGCARRRRAGAGRSRAAATSTLSSRSCASATLASWAIRREISVAVAVSSRTASAVAAWARVSTIDSAILPVCETRSSAWLAAVRMSPPTRSSSF